MPARSTRPGRPSTFATPPASTRASLTGTAPDAAACGIGPTRRAAPTQALGTVADVWRDPVAWPGTTSAEGPDLPGAVAGAAGAAVADEPVIHGWDPVRARGPPYEPDPAAPRVTWATATSLVRSIDETPARSYLQRVVLRTSYMRRDT
ncbi:hypothetical protein [Streptomyces sp. NPDC020996]|uniref:hypothetical protein n=1 Tax=Streptomyces sp. NPDC020996 TaxID=3154791 RepID=UPI0033EF6C4B